MDSTFYGETRRDCGSYIIDDLKNNIDIVSHRRQIKKTMDEETNAEMICKHKNIIRDVNQNFCRGIVHKRKNEGILDEVKKFKPTCVYFGNLISDDTNFHI
ncbi:hypothetical protein COBT_003384 [Conglomerata obtusa]